MDENINKELDQYGVWIKTPPHNAAAEPLETNETEAVAVTESPAELEAPIVDSGETVVEELDSQRPDMDDDFGISDSLGETEKDFDKPEMPVVTDDIGDPEVPADIDIPNFTVPSDLFSDEFANIPSPAVEKAAPEITAEQEENSVEVSETDPEATTAQASSEDALADLSDGDVSLDAFFSDTPDGEISVDDFFSSSGSSDNNLQPDGEISLDAFLDASDFGIGEQQESTAENYDDPLDIDLTFEDTVVEEEPDDEDFDALFASTSSGSGDIDISSFSSGGDDFDAMFDSIQDTSESTVPSSADTSSIGESESIDLSEFGLGTEDTGNIKIGGDDEKSKAPVVRDYDLDINLDSEDSSDIGSEVIEENVMLEMDTKETGSGSLKQDEKNPFSAPDSDFDVDSLFDSIVDETDSASASVDKKIEPPVLDDDAVETTFPTQMEVFKIESDEPVAEESTSEPFAEIEEQPAEESVETVTEEPEINEENVAVPVEEKSFADEVQLDSIVSEGTEPDSLENETQVLSEVPSENLTDENAAVEDSVAEEDSFEEMGSENNAESNSETVGMAEENVFDDADIEEGPEANAENLVDSVSVEESAVEIGETTERESSSPAESQEQEGLNVSLEDSIDAELDNENDSIDDISIEQSADDDLPESEEIVINMENSFADNEEADAPSFEEIDSEIVGEEFTEVEPEIVSEENKNQFSDNPEPDMPETEETEDSMSDIAAEEEKETTTPVFENNDAELQEQVSEESTVEDSVDLDDFMGSEGFSDPSICEGNRSYSPEELEEQRKAQESEAHEQNETLNIDENLVVDADKGEPSNDVIEDEEVLPPPFYSPLVENEGTSLDSYNETGDNEASEEFTLNADSIVPADMSGLAYNEETGIGPIENSCEPVAENENKGDNGDSSQTQIESDDVCPAPDAVSDEPVAETAENENIPDAGEEEMDNTTGDVPETASLISQIAKELSYLREEINQLKTEFAEIRGGAVSKAVEPVDEKETGFFSDMDDDDTIALSGDELSNILSSAEFTPAENQPAENLFGSVDESVAVPDQEYENNLNVNFDEENLEEPNLDSVELASSDAAEEENLPAEIDVPKVDDVLVESSETAEDEPLEEISETEELVEPEETVSDDSEVVRSEIADEENASVEEADDSFETPVVTDSLDSEVDNSITQDNYDYLSEDVDQQEIVEEDEKLEPGISEEPVNTVFDTWEASTPEAESVEESEETSEAPESDFQDQAPENAELDNSVEEDFQEPVATEDTVTEEVQEEPEAPEFDEPTVAVVEDAVAEESVADEVEPEAQEEVVTEVPSGSVSSIPEDMKQEIKSVLAYMDQLLESLPEDKIAEFAQSEQFSTYKKLFNELGLS